MYIIIRQWNSSDDIEKRQELYNKFKEYNLKQKQLIDKLSGKFRSQTDVFDEFENGVGRFDQSKHIRWKFGNDGHLYEDK